MRLFVRGPEGLVAAETVQTAEPTVLSFDAALSDRADVVDVLCLRPDGLTWHLGSTAGRPGTHHYEIELSPFRLPGVHELTVEIAGRTLPHRLTIEVTRAGNERRPRRSGIRYLGRGQR